ncbi:MAG TPA: hypothetical protein VHE59_04835 [Mucilaginibacter sp.]|nr:hypothetical protein [Mucilaginibacter sp.]
MKTFHILPATVIFSLFLTACTLNYTRTNRESDKEDAEKITSLLFYQLQRKDYAGADSLFSKDFFSVTTKEKLNDIFRFTQERLGDLQDTHLSDWQTKVVRGTDASSEYILLYGNTYKKSVGQVKITLKKDPDNKIRILGYTIRSDGFDDK